MTEPGIGTCTNECSSGQIGCNNNIQKWSCGENNDGDSCLDKMTINCASGQTCSNGDCVVITDCITGDETCPQSCWYNRDNDCNYCGDGVKKSPNDGGKYDNYPVEEECDDGDENSNPNDGCSACKITDGWECVENQNGKSTCVQSYIPITACGDIITNNMNYLVKNNLKTLTVNGAMQSICLKIIASNITIDFNGYNITHESGSAANAIGISIENIKNIAIKNASIGGDGFTFDQGIEIKNSENIKILNSKIKGNKGGNYVGIAPYAGGIKIIDSINVTIKDNYILNNLNAGIETNSFDVILEGNKICYNGLGGRRMDITCIGDSNRFKGSNNVIGGGEGNFRNEGACSFSQLTNTNNDCSVQ